MKDYIEQVKRSESVDFEEIKRRFSEQKTIRMAHAALGLTTEVGEFVDVVKKQLFYGRLPDLKNCIEELGDICWYLGIAMDVLGTNFDEVQQLNIAKLRKRYPEKFTEDNAINRDIENEMKVFSSDKCLLCGNARHLDESECPTVQRDLEVKRQVELARIHSKLKDEQST